MMKTLSSRLIDQYRLYYSNPTSSRAYALYDAIQEYDGGQFTQTLEDIRYLWDNANNVHPIQGHTFSSNGSTTNHSRNYVFGPHKFLWLSVFREKGIILHIVDKSFDHDSEKSLSRWRLFWHEDKAHFVFETHFQHPDAIAELILSIQLLYNQYGPISIMSIPCRLFYLFRKREFLDFCDRERFMISRFITTDSEPFYDSSEVRRNGTHVNNKMHDWFNGVRFYTCIHNQRHFYPTCFVQGGNGVDLLNLVDKRWKQMADWLTFHGLDQICPCGHLYLDHTFIPHYKYAIQNSQRQFISDIQLAEHIKTPLFMLQFIQVSTDLIEIVYVENDTRLHDSDQEFLQSYFASVGFLVRFKPSTFLPVGINRKFIAFWRNEKNVRYETYRTFDSFKKPEVIRTLRHS